MRETKYNTTRKDQHDDMMIDTTAEVQKLRLRYDELLKTKELQEEQKRKNAETPCKRSIDLYEMGKTKLLVQNIETSSDSSQSLKTRSTSPTPISICNRLYSKGMEKVMAERMVEEAKKEEQVARDRWSALRKRDPSPIPICDRLYERGMTKVMAGKMAEKKEEEREDGDGSRGIEPTYIPVCDRLYREAMDKRKLLTAMNVSDELETKSQQTLPSPDNYNHGQIRPSTCWDDFLLPRLIFLQLGIEGIYFVL